ncbi:MAG TPA: phospholipase D-like domain-containing protein [Kofleriaceae bacterium]|jgi:phosphatidylserine/phosphatidylglycerophosphate/cardiolipin synthase-like enzyme|nr:phospholipase D-like domain-containing protein [Kofleriaceae bacterium]
MKLVFGVLLVVACGPTAVVDEADGDDPLSGSGSAATTPILEGALTWGSASEATFKSGLELDYFTFSLSGSATVTLETTGGSSDLDTILYVYDPPANSPSWGAYLAKNDNGGEGELSKLTLQLDAGAYRALIKRKSSSGAANVELAASCSGGGCAVARTDCSTTSPRSSTPTVFIGPDNWEPSIEAAIDKAMTSLDVQMYLFTITDVATHIIDAQNRGVAVRVLLDASESPNNTAVTQQLTAANVPNHLDPTVFSFAHAKYMIVDQATAVILSGNFNVGATTADPGGERNYGVIDTDPDDVADLQSIYETDWVAGPEPELGCTRLIVSPINSQARIVAHVDSAMKTLDIEVLYLDDTLVQNAVIAAQARGVAVRVLLSDPAKNPQNTATQTLLTGHGIPTKILYANYLHTKMIQADGIALVGSENMSDTSFNKNREVGELIFEPMPAGQIHAQYEADWAAGE